ncbi:MAG TPA: HAMP domain-containing sensor histidine kinase [Sumerlaeia bacterium]|nr:HAMP domain-containing sensor histidine kinase [Sumerlaeia bacterium]
MMEGPQNSRSIDEPGGDEQSTTVLNLHIEERLHGFALVRFLVIGAIAGGAILAREVVGIEDLDVGAFWILAGVMCAGNTAVFLTVRPYRKSRARAARAQLFLVGVLHFTIALDFLCLTVALWLVGGPKSPFQAFFVFHVIIASVLMSVRATFAHALVGYLLLAGLTIGMWRGWIPCRCPVGMVASDAPIGGRYVLTVLVVQGMLFVLVAFLVTNFMKLFREGESKLFHTNQELNRLSQMRRDFLHIALHNMGGPVSAVSMLLSNLRAGYAGEISEPQEELLSRSQERLGEMQMFLQDLDSLALLDTGQLGEKTEAVDVRQVLQDLVVEMQVAVQAKRHVLTLDVPEDVGRVKGIPRLVREAIANLVQNAVKYTPDGGKITVRARNEGSNVRIEVEDNGIGISPHDQKRLFQEFVRIQRPGTPVSNVTGSGLGLFIVRRIAEALGGSVEVFSQEGRGSVFVIELPANA